MAPRPSEPIYAAPVPNALYGPMPQDARMMSTLMTDMQGLVNDMSTLKNESKQRNLASRRGYKQARYEDTDAYC